jgi:hypothetical protein
MNLEHKIIAHIKKNISNEIEESGQLMLPSESQIHEKVKALQEMPSAMLAIFFEVAPSDFNGIDWSSIYTSLREEVLVKHEQGKGLIDEAEVYDKNWFSKFKLTSEFDNYYSERFNDFYKEKLGPQVRFTLNQDTESILNLCGSPSRETVKHIRGLVFGFVQSGKTLNYASVSNAAMGVGYNMIVILAGATNILRDQTQFRINHDLIGHYNGKSVGVGRNNNKPSKKPISLTTLYNDFKTKEANAQTNGINLENIKVPVIAVIKKNVTPLKNLKEWIENQAGQGGSLKKSLLLIDDESDYASVNTKEEEDPTSINKGIRDLLNSFDVSSYLAVTATPFANILINHEVRNNEYGADLFPRSFIWALDKPDTYIGVKETLGENFVDIYKIDKQRSEEEINEEIRFVLTAKKGDNFEQLPFFIKHAICKFLYDVTCLRKERSSIDHLSMLVNISRLTDHHIEISGLIEEFTDDLYKTIRNSSFKRINNSWLLLIKKFATNNLNTFNSITEFWKELEYTMSITEIFDIHQRTKVVLNYPIGIKRNSILIGGLSLSRGFTVEGLITSVFLRTTKTFDTLMQMGRWFGHKKGILKFVSVYSTPTIQNRFELIDESIEDLLQQIDEMRSLKLSPREFGLKILRHPNVVIENAVRELPSRQGLEVVARSKRKSAHEITIKLSLGDRILETVRFLYDKQSLIHNDKMVHSFFKNLDKCTNWYKYNPITFPSIHVDIKNKESILGFLDVPNSLVKDFLLQYKLPVQKLIDTHSKLPMSFLKEFLEKRENEKIKWDVSLVSGGESESVNVLSKEYRMVKRTFEMAMNGESIKLPNNQLSIPSHEFRFLTKWDEGVMVDRSKARQERKKQTEKPLLLIFPIKPAEGKNEKVNFISNEAGIFWGWAISMPCDGSDLDHVTVLANSVMIQELLEDYKQDVIENEDN